MKKYKCPYCQLRTDRLDLVCHIDEEHQEMIPENHSPARLVFNVVNKNKQSRNLKAISESSVDESWREELGLIVEDMKLVIENLEAKKLKSLYRIKNA